MKWLLLFLCSLLFICTGKAQQKGKLLVTSAAHTTIPEGIAIHQRTGDIYISSINQHKIIKIDKRGRATDFFPADSHGFLEGLGMKIDEVSHTLWAVSNKKEKEMYTSRLQAFDLKTGNQKERYSITDTVPHLFNDLVLLNGVIYITDTYSSAVYQLNTRQPALTLFSKHEHLTYPNGITVDPVSQRLYIASYKNGLIMIDLVSNETLKLPIVSNATFFLGLDGIVFYRNTITGIYNLKDRNHHAVLQYFLSADGKSVMGEKIIDQGNLHFHEPTTAAVRKKKLYVIANSHLGIYNANKESTTGVENKLSPPALLIYKLKIKAN